MPEPKYQIKAVLFDLGETLLNFGRVDTTKLFRQGARLSYDFLKDLGRPQGNFNLYCWKNLFAIRLRYWLSGLTRKDFDALQLLKKINTAKTFNPDEQNWRHLGWLWYEPLSKMAAAEPDIVQTLAAIREMGLKLGILSNTFINGSCLEKHLSRFGILEFFDVLLYSYSFDFRKPDIRIFKAAAEKIGNPPQNIMFVGDRIDIDIAPALKAGMTAVLKAAYTNDGKTAPDGAWKISRLCELPALITKINQCSSQKSPGSSAGLNSGRKN